MVRKKRDILERMPRFFARRTTAGAPVGADNICPYGSSRTFPGLAYSVPGWGSTPWMRKSSSTVTKT